MQFVRDWILEHMLLKGVISLPSETFAPYGTTTKTSLCFFQKHRSSQDRQLDNDITFYLLENIDYEATGRFKVGSDVAQCISYMSKSLVCEQ